MRHFIIFFVTFLLTSLSYDDNSDIVQIEIQIEKSEQDIIEMAKRPLVLQKASFSFAPLLKSCHSSHYSHRSHSSHVSHRSHYSSR